ncbi:MAG: AAA family ATPase [Pseudomonadota bacterium]|nr:AAA family ATPase [Pseudomonadota bacterium]
MITRCLELSPNESFFLLGSRAVGKKTLIDSFPHFNSAFCINLLLSDEKKLYTHNPSHLRDIINALPNDITHVIIHELQKIPLLIDIMAELLHSSPKYFILTSSNIRELKFASPNLLTGNPIIHNLLPFTYLELKKSMTLKNALRWGLLPTIVELKSPDEKVAYLSHYAETYLQHEIIDENIIADTEAFKRFIELVAYFNGEIIKYKKIARDCQADKKSVRNYFIVLVDTFMGFFLVPFKQSFRGHQRETPKFYFFDAGVARAFAKQLSSPIRENTHYISRAFTSFIITQCKHLAAYYHRDYRLTYFRTKEENEIELVVERLDKPLVFITINSSKCITEKHLATLKEVTKYYWDAEAVCFSREEHIRMHNNITIYPWAEGIKKYFGDFTTSPT